MWLLFVFLTTISQNKQSKLRKIILLIILYYMTNVSQFSQWYIHSRCGKHCSTSIYCSLHLLIMWTILILLSTGISANSTMNRLQKEVFREVSHEILMGQFLTDLHKVIHKVFSLVESNRKHLYFSGIWIIFYLRTISAN